ncbi:MAG: hypothetical protein M1825_006293 [Sarcosagium campestre]|nr:MAG: hypothetical protein M1825_006293 [Sarcosagium campestre]
MDPSRISDGQVVQFSFDASFIAASYIVSCIGSWTTLELLHWRVATRGLCNWILLVGASVLMGSVALWSSYYVAARAMIFGDGEAETQRLYGPVFAVLSFFAPILILLPAFLAVGSNEKVGALRVIIGGASVALAACTQHYISEVGIANYSVEFDMGHVIGSTIIAITVCCSSLSLLLVLRASWSHSWWKRAMCGLILAAGVAGMRWTAIVGTRYRLKASKVPAAREFSPCQASIAALIMSICACAILAVMAFLAHKKKRTSASKAQQVVLASITFDPDGRLLVTPEGILPSQQITSSYLNTSSDDVFRISHPAFLWIYRVSRNWKGIVDLIPIMRKHFDSNAAATSRRPRLFQHGVNVTEGERPEDYSLIFRKLFCIAAADLADQINEPLEKLGSLYGDIMTTGRTGKKCSSWQLKSRLSDAERASEPSFVFGRGQLLFVVRQASKSDASRLQKQGFRFTGLQNVAEILSKRMEVDRNALVKRMEKMRAHSSSETLQEPGVHIGAFSIRANVGGGGFDALVRRDANNLLPSVSLPLTILDDWQIGFLAEMDTWTLARCLPWLCNKAAVGTDKEQHFAGMLADAFMDLAEKMDPLFQEARLVAMPFEVPCRDEAGSQYPGQGQMICFHTISPIHTFRVSTAFDFVPLDFFRCQQRVYQHSPDHEVFARRVHRELAPVLFEREKLVTTPSIINLQPRSSIEIPRLTPSKNAPPPRYGWLSALERRPPYHTQLDKSKTIIETVERNSWGGILVSQEVNVQVQEATSINRTTEVDSLGFPSMSGGTATTEVEDPKTYIDSLLAICIESR